MMTVFGNCHSRQFFVVSFTWEELQVHKDRHPAKLLAACPAVLNNLLGNKLHLIPHGLGYG